MFLFFAGLGREGHTAAMSPIDQPLVFPNALGECISFDAISLGFG